MSPYLEVLDRIRERFSEVVEELYSIRAERPALGFPPNVELGEVSITACFDLAKRLRQAPRKIADAIAARLLPIEGVDRLSVAGAGYLNLYLDRAALAASVFRSRGAAAVPHLDAATEQGKILVEHTSINPNKAAHIGHVRNAVLGDTFARLLRSSGRRVEVQNYIDNTGVQVADVVVGFIDLEGRTLDDVEALLADPAVRFDYLCWDLYARVTQAYEADPALAARRSATLHAIEDGHGERAAMGERVATAIVRLHLATMARLGIYYDLLVQESEILRLDFWKYAFELLKERGALRFEDEGKNRGCWVMRLAGDAGEASGTAEGGELADDEVKIIVRSNGTVTYVGKDIAYHLWKFGLLARDFGYEVFEESPRGRLWRTTTAPSPPDAPAFGQAAAAYAVIDSRQAYLQRVVAGAFHELGYHAQAEHLHHFAYEVVNLSLEAAAALGVETGSDEQGRGYVEVSGRRGLGVKADDLIDTVIEKALAEVRAREITADPEEQMAVARMIGVAALRYFLLKFTRRSTIAFDFKAALAFEGETGPYLQYSVVRARNILRKSGTDKGIGESTGILPGEVTEATLKTFFEGGQDVWELALLAAQLEMNVQQAVESEEPAVLAKYAFRLAQAFNNFYHHHRVLVEPDSQRRACLLFLVTLASSSLKTALDLLGIAVPDSM